MDENVQYNVLLIVTVVLFVTLIAGEDKDGKTDFDDFPQAVFSN